MQMIHVLLWFNNGWFYSYPSGLINQLIGVWEIWNEFYICNFQKDFNDCWLRHLLWNRPNECHWTSLMIRQHWFRQQAITWANVDPNLCLHMASLGHNELTPCGPVTPYIDIHLDQHWLRLWLGAMRATSHNLRLCSLGIFGIHWRTKQTKSTQTLSIFDGINCRCVYCHSVQVTTTLQNIQ